MASDVTRARRGDPIRQYAVFAENKVGRLNELIALLGSHYVHPLAISTQDTTDSSIIRMVVDDPEKAESLLASHGYAFAVSELTAVEMDDAMGLRRVLTTLMEGEINLHYIYPFIMRPHGKSGIAIHLEDNELAAQLLNSKGLRVLTQRDLSR